MFFGVISSALSNSQSADSLAPLSTPTIDSVQLNLVKVQQMEKHWYNELYNNSQYDTLTFFNSNQSYEPIYYPELPTDTLKKRLAVLDAKSPFNIAYAPSL